MKDFWLLFVVNIISEKPIPVFFSKIFVIEKSGNLCFNQGRSERMTRVVEKSGNLLKLVIVFFRISDWACKIYI